MTGQTLNGTTVTGHRPLVRTFEGFRPIDLGGLSAADDQPQPEPQPTASPADTAPMPGPAYDPIALAEADRIRKLAEAEAEARRIEAEAAAKAAEILATEEAEKQRITNERSRMRLAKEQADHEAHLAKKRAETTKSKADEEKASKAEQEAAEEETARAAEQQRTHAWWKWAARGIYAAGLIIAAPIQFLAFWSRSKPFLVAAPVLLEGLALALAFGAAWAVAHRRDTLPYRIGIMLGACLAAGVNLWHGMSESKIGLNAGIIGALASLGGPIVLMAYERGMAQRADGVPSRREIRAVRKAKAAEEAAKAKARADRKAAEEKAAAEKKARDAAAEAEQQRKDAGRREGHEKVWKVAEAMRSARGSAAVTEQIWAEAWYRVTGSKLVGITPEIEAASHAAQARMKGVAEATLSDESSQVKSQIPPRPERDPNTPDGRRSNGGTPPRRTSGDTPPYHSAAKSAAADTARRAAPSDTDVS